MRNIKAFLSIVFFVFFLHQTVFSNSDVTFSGHIYGRITHKGSGVEFANVAIKGSNIGATSDAQGHYLIDKVPPGKQVVVVSVVGYMRKELDLHVNSSNPVILNFELERDLIQLEQVVVTGTMKEVSLKDSPVKMEVITGSFLQKTASANLMESIDLVNGLQSCSDCNVCGTTGIHINGMESSNTAILIDGMPIMGALASVYGLNGIPTEMIDRIEILKGPSSTLYGSEAVAGVINVITKSPQKAPMFSFNSFYTSDAENNVDFSFVPLKKGRIKTMVSGNYYRMQNFLDDNKDGFADMVLTAPRFTLFNKWSVDRPENRIFTVSARYYYENRYGGTRDFLGNYDWKKNSPHRGNDSVYGESIFTNRFELIGSYQLPISAENIRLDFSWSHHDQDSWYATDHYAARQEILFGNLIWTKDLNDSNDFLLGLSSRYQTYDDNTEIIPEKDKQFIPGVFAQNTWSMNRRTKLLGGIRMDHHKKHGLIFSPRLNLSYKAGNFTTFRFNSGTGFRIVNVFSEDHAAYHGIREVVIVNEIKPEQSINATFSLNHLFNIGSTVYTFDADVFYTHFTNKIIADYDTDPTKLIYSNLEGESFAVSRGVSSSIQAAFEIPLRITLGATYQDVYSMESDEAGVAEKHEVIKVPKFTGLYTLSYELSGIRTSFDLNGTYTSSMRMPQFDAPYERPLKSPYFFLHNFMVNHRVSTNAQVYFEVKNIGNFTQESPIINPFNPFDDSFDTSYSYGPLRGRRFALGFRMFIP